MEWSYIMKSKSINWHWFLMERLIGKSLIKLRDDYALALRDDVDDLFENLENTRMPLYDVSGSGPKVPCISALYEHLPMIAVLPKLSSIQNQILHC